MSNVGFASHYASSRRAFKQLRNEKLVIDRIIFSLENESMPFLGCDKGIDVWMRLQNATVNDAVLSQIEGAIRSTINQDPSVETCTVVTNFITETETIEITINVFLLSGTAFTASLTNKTTTWTVNI